VKPPAPAAVARELHVLVIDDSAVVRQVVATLLSGQPGLSVSVAADPLIAFERMKKRRPDVILLDLELPRMDGISFLRKLMQEDPIPVVVCAGLAGVRAERGLRALEEGAIEIVTKPSFGVGEFLRASSEKLVETLRAAAAARVSRRGRADAAPPVARAAKQRAPGPAAGPARSVIAIGASTGGTEAIRHLVSVLPGDAPALAIVQHMPDPYTLAFAQRLDAISALDVKQAEDGDELRPGRALIAPGNRHLRIRAHGGAFFALLDDSAPVSRHRPSVDVLFRSLAESAGSRAIGVLLTGMGSDGADGLLALRRAGAATLVQDESTSVVFGMPREAIERGAAQQVLPLEALAATILECARGRAA
jgi:two-component system chemotaxis response regulator CheB